MAQSRIIARFADARAEPRDERSGIALGFEPLTGRLGVARIEDWIEVGPELSVDAALGIGKLLRILRVARVSAPFTPEELVGDLPRLLPLLERAVGTELRLVLRKRSKLHFLAWTEEGLLRFEDVSEIETHDDAYVVRPRGARFPRRLPRESVIRQQSETERWLEIVEIRRPE